MLAPGLAVDEEATAAAVDDEVETESAVEPVPAVDDAAAVEDDDTVASGAALEELDKTAEVAVEEDDEDVAGSPLEVDEDEADGSTPAELLALPPLELELLDASGEVEL